MLLDDTTEEAAVAVAHRLLDASRHRLTIQGHGLRLSASVGVALSETGDSACEVVRRARAALGLAKDEGGGRSVLHDRLAHLLLMQEVAVTANQSNSLEQAAQVVIRQFCAHLGCAIGHLWAPPADSSSDSRPSRCGKGSTATATRRSGRKATG